MAVEIRAYETRDLDRVIAVWRSATVLAHPFMSEAELDRDEQLIRARYMRLTETWCAWRAEQLVGFISLREGRIVALFVDSECQRAGVGSRLLAHVNALHGPLSVEVFADNEIAMPFYRRHGFAYVRDEPSDVYPDHPQWLMAQPGAPTSDG